MTLAFDRPATYRVRVQGYLDDRWSDRLGGMEITASRQAHETAETVLVGWLPDQAALCGVLNALYNLHLALLSVELICTDKDAGGAGATQEDRAQRAASGRVRDAWRSQQGNGTNEPAAQSPR